MRCRWLLLPAVALLAGADDPKKAPADAERIQGVWQVVSAERAGKNEIENLKYPLQIEFAADTFWFHLPAGAGRPRVYKFDPTKTPKTIDDFGDKRRPTTEPLPGIYELDGDTLKICWGARGKDRPKEFKTAAGRDEQLWVLKRKKE